VKFRRAYLRVQDRVREIEERIRDNDIRCNSISDCLKFVRDNVKGECLVKAIVLYILLKRRLGCSSCYVVLFKPRHVRGLYLHSVVVIRKDDGILVLDPMVGAPGDFPYRPIESRRNLDEIIKELGDIICIFNDEEAYIREP